MEKKKSLTFKQFVNFLKKHHKTLKRVIVKRTITELNTETVPPQRDFGETINNSKYYLIKINKKDPLRIQKDTLIHEWAHCMIPWKESPDHSDNWGIVYARVYRTIDEKLM